MRKIGISALLLAWAAAVSAQTVRVAGPAAEAGSAAGASWSAGASVQALPAGISLAPSLTGSPVLSAPSIQAVNAAVPAASLAAPIQAAALSPAKLVPSAIAAAATPERPVAPAAVSRALTPNALVSSILAAPSKDEGPAKPSEDDGAERFDGARRRGPAEDGAAPVVPGAESPRSSGLKPSSREKAREMLASVEKTEALPWSRARRWTTLAALLTTISFLPTLAVAKQIAFGVSFGLGAFSSWPVLIACAAALALAGLPVRVFAHRLAPWRMGGADPTVSMFKENPLLVLGKFALGAASEEIVYRGFAFGLALVAALKFLPVVPAVMAASFLASFVFAVTHRYGPVWTRVVGGLLYTGAFLIGGTLAFPIVAHFLFNVTLYVLSLWTRPEPS